MEIQYGRNPSLFPFSVKVFPHPYSRISSRSVFILLQLFLLYHNDLIIPNILFLKIRNIGNAVGSHPYFPHTVKEKPGGAIAPPDHKQQNERIPVNANAFRACVLYPPIVRAASLDLGDILPQITLIACLKNYPARRSFRCSLFSCAEHPPRSCPHYSPEQPPRQLRRWGGSYLHLTQVLQLLQEDFSLFPPF